VARTALADDIERAAALVEAAIPRTPGTPVLKRLVQLHARGEPLELISDPAHHLAALAAELLPRELLPTRFDHNRRKLEEEVARIID
jgi:hypothetical protein